MVDGVVGGDGVVDVGDFLRIIVLFLVEFHRWTKWK